MSQPGTEMRALRQVVRDLVAEPVPSVDFDRMEDTLRRKLQCEPPRRAPAPRTMAVWLAAALAATAVAAAAVLGPRWASPESAPVGRGAPTQPAAAEEEVVQGDRLLVGQRLVTSAAPLRVEHPERASWTLAPHSSARLVRSGEQIAVELQFGALLASVAPSSRPESFAVEVGETHVAVHGTVYRVSRREETAHVEVLHGTVAVGARSEAARVWLLTAPATGRFSLDGRRLDTAELAKTAPRSVPRAPPSARSAAASDAVGRVGPRPSSEQDPEPLEPHPSGAELERALELLIEDVRDCFASHTQPSGNVVIQARSTLHVQVEPSGRVGQLTFDPPLSPAVRACAEDRVAARRFPPSKLGARTGRLVLLTR